MELETRQRIAAWLSKYAHTYGHVVPLDERYLREGIGLLIREGVMTKQEVRAEALNEYDVIIPEDFFPPDNLERRSTSE